MVIRAVAAGLVLVLMGCATLALAAAPKPRFAFGALVDSAPPAGKDTISVDAKPSAPVSRVRVRWTSGAVAEPIVRSARARRFARVFTTRPDGSGEKTVLSIPPGAHGKRLDLTASGASAVTAMLRTGLHPTIVVSRLPAQTIRFELVTIGSGREVIRSVGCVRDRRRARGSAAISFADGSATRFEPFSVVSTCGSE